MTKASDISLEDLFGPEAENTASAVKAKKKAAQFIPEALVTFILRQQCQGCGSHFEALRYGGNSTFIRGRTTPIDRGEDKPSQLIREFRQHFGGHENLPQENVVETNTVAHCHKCGQVPPG